MSPVALPDQSRQCLDRYSDRFNTCLHFRLPSRSTIATPSRQNSQQRAGWKIAADQEPVWN